MIRVLVFVCVLCVFGYHIFGQHKQGALARLAFCGYSFKDAAVVKKQFQQQLDFLQLASGDTIIDIGSSSGAYVGLLNVLSNVSRAHFILVDIDSNCLNAKRVAAMQVHYERLRGSPFLNTISFVRNTVDSLWLAQNRYSKILLLNTLHEIPDQVAFISQIAGITKQGAELFVGELMPTKTRLVHFGCHRPLISESALKTNMAAAGFVFEQKLINPGTPTRKRNPYYYFKFVKK